MFPMPRKSSSRPRGKARSRGKRPTPRPLAGCARFAWRERQRSPPLPRAAAGQGEKNLWPTGRLRNRVWPETIRIPFGCKEDDDDDATQRRMQQRLRSQKKPLCSVLRNTSQGGARSCRAPLGNFLKKNQPITKETLLSVPADAERPYHADGYRITYGEAAEVVARWQAALHAAGYGVGDRIAVLLGNRPEMMLLKLAMNGLGISWVPVNPDYRPAEAAYLLEDSGACWRLQPGYGRVDAGRDRGSDGRCPADRDGSGAWRPAARPQASGRSKDEITGQTEASLIYTSGTTGRPKGCI